VVGWSLATNHRADVALTLSTLQWSSGSLKDAIHHSDRGCQYTLIAPGQRCRIAGAKPSIGSVGDAHYNAIA